MSEKHITLWEKHRAKGKWLFAVKLALLNSVTAFFIYTVWDYIYDGIFILKWSFFIWMFFIQFVGAMFFWRSVEKSYENSIEDAKL